NEIRDCIQDTLKPAGVAVVIECKHLCMSMRGVQKQNSVTTTSAFTGEFVHERTRNEFLRLITASLDQSFFDSANLPYFCFRWICSMTPLRAIWRVPAMQSRN